ncbi:universal stress protein [Nguyenibacter vanlangensis]|uniref:Universal stress protein n=1 Tax=Nguyenibacter vanlangensis TaxID=1216886 RepID=A0ABZ3CZS5_9PROT
MTGLLILLNRPDQVAALLDAARDVAGRLAVRRLDVAAAREPPDDTILPTEEILTEADRARIRAAQRAWAGALHRQVVAWADALRARDPAALAPDGLALNWLDPEMSAARLIMLHAADDTAIVTGFPHPHDGDQARRGLHAALFDSRRPVLLVPEGWHAGVGRRILLAWTDMPACHRAVAAARPLIAQAEQVAVLDRDGSAPPANVPGGRILPSPPPDGSAAEQADAILAAAGAAASDLLVIGGYTHGVLHDRLRGSVTDQILAHAAIPTWIQH